MISTQGLTPGSVRCVCREGVRIVLWIVLLGEAGVTQCHVEDDMTCCVLCIIQDVLARLRQQVSAFEDDRTAAAAANEQAMLSAARGVAAVGRALCEALPQLSTEEAAPQDPHCSACIDCHALLHLQVRLANIYFISAEQGILLSGDLLRRCSAFTYLKMMWY